MSAPFPTPSPFPALKGVLWPAETKQKRVLNESCLTFGLPEIDGTLPDGGLPPGTIHEWETESGFSPYCFFKPFYLASRFIKMLSERVFECF